jgi:hypothetical protein
VPGASHPAVTGDARPGRIRLAEQPVRSVQGPSHSYIDDLVSHPNDQVQQRGRQERIHTSKSRNAGPVCCNGWFGPDAAR